MNRKYLLLRNRLQAWSKSLPVSFLKFLSEKRLIVLHECHRTDVRTLTYPRNLEDLKTGRFVLSMSYVQEKVTTTDEFWFETKKGKRIYTVQDDSLAHTVFRYRAQLESFYAHFDHKTHMWVHRKSPVVLIKDNPVFSKDYTQNIDCKTYHLDFSKCQYKMEFTLDYEPKIYPSEEVLERSYEVLINELMGKVSEINELLTGVKYDGALMSPDGLPLSDNLVCRHCGCPVFASKEGHYKFLCPNHGVLEFDGCVKVDLVRYKSLLENCECTLERFCCPQDSSCKEE